jgi:hypothetical protein
MGKIKFVSLMILCYFNHKKTYYLGSVPILEQPMGSKFFVFR